MDDAAARHRALNHLTTIKLAVQILERKTEPSDFQRRLARRADEATDDLIRELMAAPSIQEHTAVAPPDPGPREPTRLRSSAAVEHRIAPSSRPRPTFRPPLAVAVLMAIVLAALIFVGAAMLVQVLLVVLLVGAVVWLSRR